uniref:Short trialysin 2 n=1 Tax=Triatoma infestans TaxID=30076 RepID=A6YPD9_TRIIF|nr:short trialysin 2 [Triatoma infestans]
MSKFWLLLLLVAAFQFARCYPAIDEYEDEARVSMPRPMIPGEEPFILKPGVIIPGKAIVPGIEATKMTKIEEYEID